MRISGLQYNHIQKFARLSKCYYSKVLRAVIFEPKLAYHVTSLHVIFAMLSEFYLWINTLCAQ